MPTETKEDTVRKGFHNFSVPGSIFEIPTRYELIKPIGILKIIFYRYWCLWCCNICKR